MIPKNHSCSDVLCDSSLENIDWQAESDFWNFFRVCRRNMSRCRQSRIKG